MTENDIKEICKQYDINNYTINSDMTVDVNGNVNLFNKNKKLTTIPLNFGTVLGTFYCNNNLLSSLEHCPQYVGKDFYCYDNKLTSLQYCPNHISGIFSCSSNKLTSLEYCPTYIGGMFSCNFNKLTTLQHLPMNFYIGDDFYCSRNNITSPIEFSRLFFGTIGGNILTGYDKLDIFLNKHKNPSKKDLPKILSELRKIKL